MPVRHTAEEASDGVEQVRRAIEQQADELGLARAELVVTPVLNLGGFVNASYRVSDGRSTFFLKLSGAAESRAQLARGRAFSRVLAQHYHAPRPAGWLELSAPGRSGPLFEWIAGVVPTRIQELPLADVRAMLQRLHSDAALAALLAEAGDPLSSCADAYRRTYHSRFTGDLEIISAEPPPFVDRILLAWMQSEAAHLESLVSGTAAFQEPADSPTHGDLWLNNFLITNAGQWYVLDWDDLALSDPVLDWTMLFGPTRADLHTRSDEAGDLALSPTQSERLPLYARAALLDWIIDPLADWVEALNQPHFRAEVQAGNEIVHGQALQVYRERYARNTRWAES